MPKTPSKMHMYDMVKIDIIVFEIVGGGLDWMFNGTPTQCVGGWSYPGSDGVKDIGLQF